MGKTLHFRFNGARNQIEEFSGTIENMYNSIFVVKVSNPKEQIKSFSYADILTESLQIFVKWYCNFRQIIILYIYILSLCSKGGYANENNIC